MTIYSVTINFSEFASFYVEGAPLGDPFSHLSRQERDRLLSLRQSKKAA